MTTHAKIHIANRSRMCPCGRSHGRGLRWGADRPRIDTGSDAFWEVEAVRPADGETIRGNSGARASNRASEGQTQGA